LKDVMSRQQEDRADAVSFVEEVPYEEASRYGVCDTSDYGEYKKWWRSLTTRRQIR
jgi:glucose-1-phosphate thymidylyltransferase